MKLRIMRDEQDRQALIVNLNERQDGEAFMEFADTDTGPEVAAKLRDLADTIDKAAQGG